MTAPSRTQSPRVVSLVLDCLVCGHHAKHVIGRATSTLYCLGCSGECRHVEGTVNG